VHNITLNSLHNIGIRIVFPSKIYSFKILSTPGDLFPSTINTRLMKWSEDNSVLTDAQFGFRPGYGTHDVIFALHSIMRLLHNITLNSLHNIGIMIVFPSKIYSFKILSTPGDLFRFKPLIQVSISC
jgi:hypothetical protein